MTKAAIKEENFDIYNKNFLKLKSDFDGAGVRVADIDRAFSLHGGIAKNLSVLELGCFYGREYTRIKDYTQKYIGIDGAHEAIAHAKNTFPGVNFVCHDFETYEHTHCYDIVFAFSVLLHCDRETICNIFTDIYNNLNPGGIFYISMRESGASGIQQQVSDLGIRTFFYYSPGEYESIAGDCFDVVYKNSKSLEGKKYFTLAFKKK